MSMLGFHQNNCDSAIKHMLFYHRHTSILCVLSHTCVFLVTAMHALSLVRCVWE